MKGVDIVVRGSVGHMSAFMAQSGCLVVCGDAGEALGDSIYEARLYVRGAVESSAPTASRRSCATSTCSSCARCSSAPGPTTPTPPVPALRLGAPALQLRRRQRGGLLMATRTRQDRAAGTRPARVVPLRPQRDPRDPARRARGHLRHPRLRREAAAPPLRRPALPRRERLALPARGLPRALQHGRRAGHALRAEPAPAEDPDHDRRHELRRALGAGEGGARPRRERRRHVHDDGRRRHDARGARATPRRSSTSCCPRVTA